MKKYFIAMVLLIVVQEFYGQIEFSNVKIYLKNKSIISGNILFLDSKPSEILVNNEYFLKIDSIDYLKNESFLLRSVIIDSTQKLLIAIVEGSDLNLYKENEGIRFYVVKDDKSSELDGKDILIKKKSKTYKVKSRKYIGTLKYLTSDKIEFSKELDYMKFTEAELRRFVKKYNQNISYLKPEKVINKKYFTENEIIFKYTHMKSSIHYHLKKNGTPSFFEIGFRTKVREGSRSSINTMLKYGKISWEYGGVVSIAQINFNYLQDFYRTLNSEAYVRIILFDISYVMIKENGNSFHIYPRFNFSIGYRYHIHNKINLFVEVNHLFNIHDVPKNFSAGFAYVL